MTTIRAQRFDAEEVRLMTDADFFEYFRGRQDVSAKIFSQELKELTYELFRRIADHEEHCIKTMNYLLTQLRGEMQEGYLQLLQMTIKFMYEAESKDELEMYYNYLTSENPETFEGQEIPQGGIAKIFAEIGVTIPPQFWKVLKDLKDTRLIHLESEEKHWQGVKLKFSEIALGATMVLPVSEIAYAAYAWGSWGGLKAFHSFESTFAKKPEPTFFQRIVPQGVKDFWRDHKKAIIIGGVATTLIAIGIAAPFVIPLLPIVAGLAVATVVTIKTVVCATFLGLGAVMGAGYAIKLGFDERKRANRVAGRLDQFANKMDEVDPGMREFIQFKQAEEEALLTKKQSSHAKVKKSFTKEIIKETRDIIKECRKIIKKLPKTPENKKVLKKLAELRYEMRSQRTLSADKFDEIIQPIFSLMSGSNTEQATQLSEKISRLASLRDELETILSPPEFTEHKSSHSPREFKKEKAPAVEAAPKLSPAAPSINQETPENHQRKMKRTKG